MSPNLFIRLQANFKKIDFKERPRYICIPALDKIEIKECGEPLVPLQAWLTAHNSKIKLVAGEADYGAATLETHKLRQTAAEMILKAESLVAEMFPNTTLKITDSFRPLSLQRTYFNKIYKIFSMQGLTGDELYTKVTSVIADPDKHPPHASGGTVDLTLFNLETNTELPMGSKLDDVADELSYQFDPRVTGTERRNRLILYNAMTDAGFANCATEWWHFSYGEREWALRSGQQRAIYDSCVD